MFICNGLFLQRKHSNSRLPIIAGTPVSSGHCASRVTPCWCRGWPALRGSEVHIWPVSTIVAQAYNVQCPIYYSSLSLVAEHAMKREKQISSSIFKVVFLFSPFSTPPEACSGHMPNMWSCEAFPHSRETPAMVWETREHCPTSSWLVACVQWNPSITDTVETQHFAPYNEVSLTQGVPVFFR